MIPILVLFAASWLLFPGPVPAAAILHAVGSTTVLPIVAAASKAYHDRHKDVTITVSGGGSGVGVAAMIQSTADLGMVSRELADIEKDRLGNTVELADIARDAVAVVVSKAVYVGGVHQLSLQQIADIYRGRIRNWREVSGPDSEILVIDKEASRGTRHVFAKVVLGDAHARAPGATVVSGSNNEEQALVANSDKAIGMLSRAWLNDAVRAVAIGEGNSAVLPSLEHIADGRYPIQRTLHILIHRSAPAAVRSFVDFLLSVPGQQIVAASGYLPVR